MSLEKLIYNLELKDLLVKGKITLKAKDQFLKASEISYDLQEKKGVIYDLRKSN